ncbi:hypothetical protein ACFXKR_34565 [Streptomyces violascens]|uniref:hypothetical protein n=1 Tax=Streptomyces violascens TaxID=67381 RepID=UPI00368AC114
MLACPTALRQARRHQAPPATASPSRAAQRRRSRGAGGQRGEQREFEPGVHYEKSDFIKELNADGDTVPGVDYTVIATKYDEITTPWQSTFMTAGPGATVQNITLQDGCFVDFSAHLSMTYSPRAIGLVKQALDPSAPAAPCVPRAPAF